jgi:hypothetical protein
MEEKNKEVEAPKKVEAKQVKSKTVNFKVKLKFNGYKRGQIIRNVERSKANLWVSKERGEIVG